MFYRYFSLGYIVKSGFALSDAILGDVGFWSAIGFKFKSSSCVKNWARNFEMKIFRLNLNIILFEANL